MDVDTLVIKGRYKLVTAVVDKVNAAGLDIKREINIFSKCSPLFLKY